MMLLTSLNMLHTTSNGSVGLPLSKLKVVRQTSSEFCHSVPRRKLCFANERATGLSSARYRRRNVRLVPQATLSSASADQVARYAGRLPSPPKLPPTPESAKLFDILPFLLKVAVGSGPHQWRLFVAGFLLIISKTTGMLVPLYAAKAVDALSGSLTHRAAVAATSALLLQGLCRALNAVAKEMQGPIFTPVAQAAARRVAYHTFSHILDLDISYHLERRTGALSRILERGTRSVSMIFRAIAFTFVPTAVELLLVCGLLAKDFTPLVCALLVMTFVAYVGWTVCLTQAATEARKTVNLLDNLTSGKAVDVLLNYETVKLFNNEQMEVQQYDEYLVGYQRAYTTTENISATLNTGQSLVLTGGLTAVSAAAVLCDVAGMTAGKLVLVQGWLLQVFAPLQFLGWFYKELRQSLVDVEQFLNILQTTPKLPDGNVLLPDTPPQDRTNGRAAVHAESSSDGGNGSCDRNGSSLANHNRGGQTSTSQRGLQLELRDVKFGYTKERQVMKGVSFSVEPGSSVAIVGPSGSGKSTILRLLMRLYDTDGGSVLFNGVDVRDLKMSSLRSAVAVVPQDSVLFNDTIMSNIAYGRPDATGEEIIEASRMARLHDAITRMPEGYETMVGERGLKLSGGEKQRVAIARAFLRQPRLLICDEATSALDTATEREIMSSLNELAEGRTSLFVAHRLSTIQSCDTILVMCDGKLVESGTHDQLMSRGQVYYDMWSMQSAQESTETLPDDGESDLEGAVEEMEMINEVAEG